MGKRHPYSLIGIDGNGLAVIGYVANAMKQCGYSRDAINMYKTDAFAGDYNNFGGNYNSNNNRFASNGNMIINN